MLRTFLIAICLSSTAMAQPSDVPHLADGTVDIARVLSTFQVQSALHSDARSGELTGVILGHDFAATVGQDAVTTAQILTIRAQTLSEEASYLVAVLLTDIVCLKQNLRPGLVNWRETAVKVNGAWQVDLTCGSSADDVG